MMCSCIVKCETMLFYAGDGKTHFVQKQMMNLEMLSTVTIDESFTALEAICVLRKLYECGQHKKNVGIFFNITLFELKVC